MIFVYTRDVNCKYEVRVEAKTEIEALEKLHEGRVVSDEETEWDCYNEVFSHTEDSS
jgi:16S rRNA U516 pseudouridylate synthase RsuA-like enzyme